MQQSWQQFYEMIGGAAATLLGLLFVSVSLNADLILGGEHRHSQRLAEQAFQNYLAVLVVSLLMAFPTMLPSALGYAIGAICGLWGLWAVRRMIQAFKGARANETPASAVRRYATTLFGYGLLLLSAYEMVRGMKGYLDYVAPGVMFLLLSATIVSWELLMKVAEEKYRARKD